MKILLANKYYYPRGGDCIHTMQLKELLVSFGHKVEVFSMQFSKNIGESDDMKYWPSEVNFDAKSLIAIFKSLVRPFGAKEVNRCFEKQLADFQPDIVHVHNIHSQLSPSIVEAARKYGVPVVWTLHDYKLICPAYTCVDNKLNVCEACIEKSHSVLIKKCIKGSFFASLIGYLELKKWNQGRLEPNISQFISPSVFLKSKMVQAGYRVDNITHLYNFIDEQKFYDKVNIKRNKQVVYVGRLSKEKGVETLCKAFSSFNDIELKIIGDGPVRRELEDKYANDKISFLGFKDWIYIKKELSKAAFLVIPSEWYENNPLTILESLTLGTPVLGSNIGGIPELINSTNGMLFEPGNLYDLMRKVGMMLKGKCWDYEQIQLQAKKDFSKKKYYLDLLEIYKLAINKK